jgi:hypothetical protein
LAVVRIRTGCRIYRELNLLNILIGLRRNRLNLRTIVINYGVVVDDVRNILRLGDNLHVLGWRLHILCVARRRPMRVANEGVSSGSDIIIRVRPGRDPHVHGDVRFGRKRSPTDVFVALSP